MNIPVIDPFNIAADPKMPFVAGAIAPLNVQQQFSQTISQNISKINLCAIRVIRHKPGRRCLIEYDLEIENPDASSQVITLIGKVHAKGTDINSYQLQQSLWNAGFSDDSEDGISVPEPIGMVPAFQMWLQRKVPGAIALALAVGGRSVASKRGALSAQRCCETQIATKLLAEPNGSALTRRIAEAAHKLHQAGIAPKRRHTMADELRILHERLLMVAQLYPQWARRLERVLEACENLGAATPEPQLRGIHRDFYPDQVIVDGHRLYLLDLDLYCEGDSGLDIGNFIGHITEQSLRTLGSPDALADREVALEERFVQLSGEVTRAAVRSYTTLTLVRHIYISTQIAERRPFTEALLELCEQRLAG